MAAFRAANRAANPDWFNAPVPSFGSLDAPLLVVGLAPGLRGANRTGRPFTGDQAGLLLFRTLLQSGLAEGRYGADPADGLVLRECRVVNAVRCVPPANRPVASEVRRCNPFLQAELAGMARLRVVLALGQLAHAAIVRAAGLPQGRHRFAHGAFHSLASGLVLADSYHVSRYNTNTGRLTASMFEAVVARVVERLAAGAAGGEARPPPSRDRREGGASVHPG